MKNIILLLIILAGCKKANTPQPTQQPVQQQPVNNPPTTQTVSIMVKGHCAYGQLKVDWDAQKQGQILDSMYAYNTNLTTITKVLNVNIDTINIGYYSAQFSGGPICTNDLTVTTNGVNKYAVNNALGTRVLVKVN